jgi:hypothetical protein
MATSLHTLLLHLPIPLSLNGNISKYLTASPSYLWVSMATSLNTLQRHLPTCESQWQPLPANLKATSESQWQLPYRTYGSTFPPVSLSGNLSTDLTALPFYMWVSMATSQTLQLPLPTCESQWQPLYRPYSSTFLPVSHNGNLSTDLTAPPSYLWVSMATSLQSLQLHLPTYESQWKPPRRPPLWIDPPIARRAQALSSQFSLSPHNWAEGSTFQTELKS